MTPTCSSPPVAAPSDSEAAAASCRWWQWWRRLESRSGSASPSGSESLPVRRTSPPEPPTAMRKERGTDDKHCKRGEKTAEGEVVKMHKVKKGKKKRSKRRQKSPDLKNDVSRSPTWTIDILKVMAHDRSKTQIHSDKLTTFHAYRTSKHMLCSHFTCSVVKS